MCESVFTKVVDPIGPDFMDVSMEACFGLESLLLNSILEISWGILHEDDEVATASGHCLPQGYPPPDTC